MRTGDTDANVFQQMGVYLHLQGSLMEAAGAAVVDGACSCKRVQPSWMRQCEFFFFLKADGFKETCLSFDISSLSLIWALRPCDRASAVLQGEFAEKMLVTVDGERKSVSLIGALWRGRQGSGNLRPFLCTGG